MVANMQSEFPEADSVGRMRGESLKNQFADTVGRTVVAVYQHSLHGVAVELEGDYLLVCVTTHDRPLLAAGLREDVELLLPVVKAEFRWQPPLSRSLAGQRWTGNVSTDANRVTFRFDQQSLIVGGRGGSALQVFKTPVSQRRLRASRTQIA
jgi:hypothetical protein